jgi:hypothetical protein
MVTPTLFAFANLAAFTDWINQRFDDFGYGLADGIRYAS